MFNKTKTTTNSNTKPKANGFLNLSVRDATDTKSISKEMLAAGKCGIKIGLEIRAAKIHSIRGVTNKWKTMSLS